MQALSEFNHARQRFILIDTRPPANPFEWKRYVVEEAARRGDKIPRELVVEPPPKPVGRPYKKKPK